MTALLLDPHGDDAALFAAYTCQREKPFVWVTDRTVPRDEVNDAFLALGCFWGENLPTELQPSHLYAPAFAPDGHEDHNHVGLSASMEWPDVPITYYCTYAPRGVRQGGTLVEPEWWMIAPKLRALSCFPSQIEQVSTRPWFTYLLDLREWISET